MNYSENYENKTFWQQFPTKNTATKNEKLDLKPDNDNITDNDTNKQ